jgi:SAM-dependent methyltransferase
MPESKDNISSDKTPYSTAVFTDYARYYDLLYRDKDYAAEAEYIAELIRKFHPATRSILELGSGTGIHAGLLAKQGYEVTGIDISPDMINIASNNVGAPPNPALLKPDASPLTPHPIFLEGDIRSIRLSRTFDAVIALFHVISYQTTNKDVTAAFETARQHLKPGGIFIFDVWYGPAVLTERPEVRIKRMADEKIEVTRLAEPVLHPNENRVDVHYHVLVRDLASQAVTELKETHAMRYFFKPEIDIIADQTGFEILHAEEWMTGNPSGQNTWGVCFILKAS